MTCGHRVSIVFVSSLAAIVLFALDGCAPTKSQQFRTSFLPPAPKADGSDAELLDKLPPVPKQVVGELPQPFRLEPVQAKGSDIDQRLHRAEEKFNEGREAYQAGNMDAARQAFDRAVDILLRAPDTAPDRAKLERRLDQMVDTIYRYDVSGLGASGETEDVVYDKAPLDSILEMTFGIDPRLKPKVREEVQVTVSQLPLEENDAVISYIHFFSTDGGKRILTAGLRRAGRYRPLIQRVLDEEGVPQELIYLAQAESGFLPRAVSYKSAAGMWQFLSWRGKEYGLNVSRDSDDRLDPEKATRAAARHLRDLYQQFGDWYLALAAYNCGPNCVDAAVRRTGYADFWTLRNLNVLPKETRNYVPAILAITIMAKNPKDYGLDQIETDQPIQYDTLKLEAPTNLALVADALERPVSEIRELNPALLKGLAPEGYELRVPKGSTHPLLTVLDSIPAAKRANWRMHRVEQGETLTAIAKRFGTATSAIVSANNNAIAVPEAGDVLFIPAAYREPALTPNRSARSQRTMARVAATSQHGKAPAGKTPVRAVARQRVSPKNVNRKAPAPRVRTASVSSFSAGQ